MKEKITLNDIAGYEEEKAEAKKIITFFKNYKEFKEMGAYIPKGLLLSGAPGVGKTLLAKAIAGESGVPFFELTGDSLDDEEGVVSSIQKIFQEAKDNAPSILFIDELDELIPSDVFTSDYGRKIQKALLMEIDGVSSSEGVLVIGTSNFRYRLPDSFLRSGRMDKTMELELPNLKERKAIFDLYLNKNKAFNGVSSSSLASKTSEFTGADIKTLINESLIKCLTLGKKKVTESDIESNIPSIKFKNIGKRVSDADQIVCAHEVGHFIAGYGLKGTIGFITVERYGNVNGHVSYEELFGEKQDEVLTLDKAFEKLVICLGGLAGERILAKAESNGATSDIMDARGIILSFFKGGAFGFDALPEKVTMGPSFPKFLESDHRRRKKERIEASLLRKAYRKASKIIKKNKALALFIKDELAKRGTLTRAEAESLIERFSKRG